MKKIFFLALFISCFAIYGQHKINNYKYVVVDTKYDFLKSPDQYQTSSLTKFLFNKVGFTSFLNTEQLPTAITTDRCASLYASVVNSSSMLTTKLSLLLKDCNNVVVYKSSIGKSKEKIYKKSYQEAIRNTFKDPVVKNYTYTPKEEIRTTANKIKTTEKEVAKEKKNILYAQATDTGYQLVDNTPKVIFKILKTNQENRFIIEGKNGILFKKRNRWFAEFYQNKILIQEEYQIRF